MIRYDDAVSAGFRRFPRVLDVVNTLQHDLAGPDRTDPLDVLPVERRIELFRDPGRGRVETVGTLEVADDVAKIPSFGARDTEQPARLAGKVDEVLQPHQVRRHRQAVLDVHMPLPENL